MARYLEAFFRHPRLLAAPVVLALLISLGVVAMQPRTYQASASVWFQSTSVTGDTSPANNYLQPADVATGVFHELLSTRSFCVAVGHRGPLAAYLLHGHLPSANPISRVVAKIGKVRGGTSATPQQTVDDAIQTLLQKQVNATVTGPQIVTITFDYGSPSVASGTLQALLDQFSDEVLSAQRAQAQQQLTWYNEQVAAQEKQVTDADAAVARYLANHPELRVAQPPPDATFAGLQRVSDQAHQSYAELLQQRDQAALTQTSLTRGVSSGFRVIDAPVPPHLPASRLKAVLSGAAGGLAVGLLVAAMAMAALVIGDPTLRTPADLERRLGLKVIGAIPELPALAARGRPLPIPLGTSSPPSGV